MADLVLLGIFIGASLSAVLTIWRKIPLLLQVPPQLIAESFVTRPSVLKRALEPTVEFFRSRSYRGVSYWLLIHLLHRIRLWLLRLERITFKLLESLQARSRQVSATEERYWSELKHWKVEVRQNGNNLPKAVLNPEPPPALSGRELPKNRKKAQPAGDRLPT